MGILSIFNHLDPLSKDVLHSADILTFFPYRKTHIAFFYHIDDPFKPFVYDTVQSGRFRQDPEFFDVSSLFEADIPFHHQNPS